MAQFRSRELPFLAAEFSAAFFVLPIAFSLDFFQGPIYDRPIGPLH
jgi:hypothetical protein